MTRTGLIRARLRSLAMRSNFDYIGIEADTEALPYRLLWRDYISGDRGTLCLFRPETLLEVVTLAVSQLQRRRAGERRLMEPMSWPEEYRRVDYRDAWRRPA